MAEDETLVQNEVGFPGRGNHFGIYAFAAGDWARRRVEILVGARKRLRFLDFHFNIATLKAAGASLVAEHLGAAVFAHVTLAEHVSHRNPLLESGPCGPVG